MPIITEDAMIRDILAQVRRIAMIGLSPDPESPSYRVAQGMLAAGYGIIPVNPEATQILGQQAFTDLKFVTDSINMVCVFRDPEYVPEIVETCIEKRVRNLWLQEGVIHHEAAEYAARCGIHVVMDRCIYKEFMRLLA